MRIGHKLAAGVVVVPSLMVTLTVVGIFEVQQIEAGLERINRVTSLKQRQAINFRGSVHDRAIALRDVVFLDDVQASAAMERLTADYEQAAHAMALLVAADADAKDRQRLAVIEQVQVQVQPAMVRVQALMAAGEADQAAALLSGEVGPGLEAWLAAINHFIDWQEEKNREAAEAAMSTARNFAWLMVSATLLALWMGSVVALWLGRGGFAPSGRAGC